MTGPMVLDLPEPPSRRAEDRLHWAARRRTRRQAKHEAWEAAIAQVTPLADPPRCVRVEAHFRLWNRCDEDNLHARLKAVLDALKQNQPPGEDLSWRYVDGMRASWVTRGYFWDDAPGHLELGQVSQEVDRSNRGVTVRILPLEGQQEEAA